MASPATAPRWVSRLDLAVRSTCHEGQEVAIPERWPLPTPLCLARKLWFAPWLRAVAHRSRPKRAVFRLRRRLLPLWESPREHVRAIVSWRRGYVILPGLVILHRNKDDRCHLRPLLANRLSSFLKKVVWTNQNSRTKKVVFRVVRFFSHFDVRTGTPIFR